MKPLPADVEGLLVRCITFKTLKGRLSFCRTRETMDVEFMCCECEPDAAISRCSPGQQKLSFAACDQDLDYESDCDSMSSCGSSAESHHSLSFTAPSYSPHSPHSGLEGMSEQATASSFVSLGLLQSSEGFQEGWLRELEAMGVPTTDDLEEALRSEGRLAYMPPKEKRPAPAPSSLAPPPSPFGQSSDQVQPSRALSSIDKLYQCVLCLSNVIRVRWHCYALCKAYMASALCMPLYCR